MIETCTYTLEPVRVEPSEFSDSEQLNRLCDGYPLSLNYSCNTRSVEQECKQGNVI